MAYTDDITSTSTSAANKYIQPYLHNVFTWTKQSHTKVKQIKLSGHQNKQHCTTHWQRTQRFWALP